MKRKIFILSILLFILCGCSAEVNLDVTTSSISEEIVITDYDNPASSYREFIPAFASDIIVDTEPDEAKSKVKYYDKSVVDFGSGNLIYYKYKFNFYDYAKARSTVDGWKSVALKQNKDENVITLSTDNSKPTYFNNYPRLTAIKINMTVHDEVINTNADSHEGNVYTWVLTPSNYKNIYMEMKLSDKKDNSSSNNNDKNNNSNNNGSYSNNEENNKNENNKEKNDEENPPLVIILLAILGFFVIVFVGGKFFKPSYK